MMDDSGPSSSASADADADADAIDGLVGALLTASRVLVGISAHSLADVEHTVTLPQFRMLVVLQSHGDINLTGAADALGVHPSTAMRMIDRLLGAGLVNRGDNPTNRREVVLSLTPAGHDLVSHASQRRRAELARVVRRMPEGRRLELIAALTDFADAAGEPAAATTPSPLGW